MMLGSKTALLWCILVILLCTQHVHSQNSTELVTQEELKVALVATDNAWLLLTGALVFLMQAGFTILEAGSVSTRDTKNILFKNVLDTCVGSLTWWAVGFAFAYGDGDHGSSRFIGNKYFFASDVPSPTVSWALWFFEFTFCAASSTIVSGAIAERATFQIYIMYYILTSAFVYPVVAHWEWSSQGWLSSTNPDNPLLDIGIIDFAGCGPVHMVGGVAALAAAYVCGYRNKHSKVSSRPPRFELIKGEWIINDIEGGSDILASLGTIMLWFSWYGFNMGSTIIISTPATYETAGRIAVTTTLSAAAAGVVTVLIGRALSKTGRFNINDANNGILAGLVSITAGCAVVEPWGAVIMGAVGACIYKAVSIGMLRVRIDDPVDAVAVHAACGMWGLFGSGLFAAQAHVRQVYGRSNHYGLFMGGGGRLLGAQVIGIIVVFAWVGAFSTLFWVSMKQLDKRNKQRVFFSIEENIAGGVDQGFLRPASLVSMQFHMTELQQKEANKEADHDEYNEVTAGAKEEVMIFLSDPENRKAVHALLQSIEHNQNSHHA